LTELLLTIVAIELGVIIFATPRTRRLLLQISSAAVGVAAVIAALLVGAFLGSDLTLRNEAAGATGLLLNRMVTDLPVAAAVIAGTYALILACTFAAKGWTQNERHAGILGMLSFFGFMCLGVFVAVFPLGLKAWRDDPQMLAFAALGTVDLAWFSLGLWRRFRNPSIKSDLRRAL